MSVTFYNAKKFNSPLNSWDTYNVEQICNRCFMALWIQSRIISNWKTSNVTNMSFMFDVAAKFDKNISALKCQKSY
nr:BspA family leucine-rich repeat surface protein [Mycoplasmopsis bovis]